MYSADAPSVQQDVEHNPFAAFYNAGYTALVPVIPPKAPISPTSFYARLLAKGSDPRGKAPGVKTPEGWTGLKGWHSRETSQADILNWHAMGASVGVRTGNGLLLIDADTLNTQHADTIRRAVERHFGPLPTRIGRAPKAGYMLRVEGHFPYSAVKFGPKDDRGLQEKVEVLSDGRQFVASGIHPQTGRPYEWIRRPVPFREMPEASPQAVDAFLNDLRSILPDTTLERSAAPGEAASPDSLKGDLQTVKAAVELLPNTPQHFQSREAYIAVGQAIRGALPDDPDEGLGLFQDFAARWAPHDPHGLDEDDLRTVAANDWRKMTDSRALGASWLVEQATRLTNCSPWFDFEAARSATIAEARETAGGIFPNAFLNGAASDRLQLVPIETLAARALEATAPPLVEGWLDQGAMSILYGESNVGKSFVAMRLGWAIAAGEAMAGCRVSRARVVYVVAEGGRGAAKRVAALRGKLGAGADGWFLLIVSPVNLLDARADLPVLVDRLRGVEGGVGLVVVDTLSRAMAGGDENASTDMGALVKNMDALRAATGAHVMAIHHSGKDRAKGARGHSLLRAATDTEIEVEDGKIVATKQRDIEARASLAFHLEGVTVGADGEGRVISSAVACIAQEGQEAPREPIAGALSEEALDLIRKEAATGAWLFDRRARARWFGSVVADAVGLDMEKEGDAVEAIVASLERDQVIGARRRFDASRNRRKFVILGNGGVFDAFA